MGNQRGLPTSFKDGIPGRLSMELVELDKEDWELVERAKELIKQRHSEISGVSAGVRTRSGNEFYGLSVDARTSTVGVCAEFTAIGSMLTKGESEIRSMVAISYKGRGRYVILPPCGKCRDLAREFGDPYVILQKGKEFGDPGKIKLSKLVPFPWNEAKS